MNNIGVTAAVLYYRGQPDRFSILSTMAYISAVLNALVFFYSISQMFGHSSGQRRCYILTLLASLIGAICDSVFFGAKIESGGGLITLNILYHSLIWLSCISLFPVFVNELRKSGLETSINIGKFFTILAWIWALISVCIGIAIEVSIVNGAISDFYRFATGRYRTPSYGLIVFAQLLSFTYHNNWAYVIIFLILFFAYTPNLSKFSSKFKTPLIVFFVFVFIAVITDTAMVAASASYADTADPIAIAVVNFIFTDLCNVIALFVILRNSKKWVMVFKEEREKTTLPS